MEDADRLFRRAAGAFRELGFPFYLAVTLLEQGEWLVAQSRRDDADPLLAEAREIFERLEATLWLNRIAAVQAAMRTEIHARASQRLRSERRPVHEASDLH